VNFSQIELIKNIRKTIGEYNDHVSRWSRLVTKPKIDDFVENDDTKISWSDSLKRFVERRINIDYDKDAIRANLYRPFTKSYLYFDKHLNERRYKYPKIYPIVKTIKENKVLCMNGVGMNKPFHIIATDVIPDVQLTPNGQTFPFYTYAEDGSNRTENISDWALEEFRKQYNDPSITKWDIFHYVYGFLHHPGYRAKYAANLRRELPRQPFAPDFHAFAKAGKRLAEIHVHFEDQPEYPLLQIENPLKPLDWRVEKMKLSPDKTALIYNDFLTLTGIPLAVYDYKLGNRSALEWIIDQYRVKTDPRSGITNDPNNPADPDYIVRLIKKIVTVSLETVQIVNGLPAQFE
jgi:predicted helicase